MILKKSLRVVFFLEKSEKDNAVKREMCIFAQFLNI